MEQLKGDIIGYLERATGREITFGRFSPSILRYIEIRDVRLLSTDGGGNVLLSVNRVRVYFNLFDFFRGKREEAIRRISIEDTRFSADLDRDKDLRILLDELLGGGGGAGGGLSAVAVSGKNLSFSVRSGGTLVESERVFFDLRRVDESYRLQLKAAVSGAFASEAMFPSGEVEVEVEFSPTFDFVSGRLALSHLETEDFVVADQTFQVRMREKVWTLRKVQDSLPIDLEVSIDPAARTGAVEVTLDGFSPLSLVKPRGRQEDLASWLNVVVTGAASVELGLPPTGTAEAESGADAAPGGITATYRADLAATLSYAFLPVSVDVAARFAGDESGVAVERFTVASDRGSLSYSGRVEFGSIRPTGVLSFDRLTYPLGRPLTGSGSFAYRDGVIRFEADALIFGSQRISDFSVTVEPRDDGADFSASLALSDDSAVNADGTIVLGPSRGVDVSVGLDRVPADSLVGLFFDVPAEAAGVAGSVLLDADFFLQSDLDRVSFSVAELNASTRDGVFRLSLMATGNNDEVRISDLSAVWREGGEGERVNGEFAISFEGEGLATVGGFLEYRAERYKFEARYDREIGLFLAGDYGLDAAVMTTGDARRFRLTFVDLPVPIADETIRATVRASGSFVSGGEWEVDLEEASIDTFPLLPTGGSLSVGGTISNRAAALSRIEFADGFSRISGTADVQYSFDDGFSVEGSAELNNTSSEESYAVAGSYAAEAVRLDLRFAEAPIGRFAELPLTGAASGTLSLAGAANAPDVRATVSVTGGRLNDGVVDIAGSIMLNDRHFRADGLNFNFRSSRLQDGMIELDFADSSFSGRARFSGILQQRALAMELSTSGQFAVPVGKTNLTTLLDSDFRALLAARSVTLGETERSDWTFTLERVGSEVSFSGGIEDGVTGVIDLDGAFSVLLGAPLPVTMSARGRLSSGEIDAVLSGVRIDMEGVESVVTIPFFNVTSGTALGGDSEVRITGRLNDPDIFGELHAKGVLGRVPVVPESIGPFDARLSFQGKKLIIDDALMPVGAGLARGYVDFTLDHWLPRSYEIELVTDPENRTGLHVRYNFGGIDIDGYANGVLTVTGDPVATSLDGDLTIRNTDIQIGKAGGGDAGNAGPGTIVDLRFTTGRQVTFYWPSETLPVLRSSADTGQVLRLRSNSLTGALSIEGDIGVRGGDIFYFKRSFYIREGNIRFNESEKQFDPFITVRAEARDVSADGENLRIYLIVDNQPLSRFNPRFESDPPMASVDILTWLGRSIVENSAGDPSLSSAFLLTTDIIGQFGIVRNVEQRIRDILQLDLFSLRTQIIQNILADSVFPTGSAPVPTRPSMGRYLDNTTLFLGKYFGNDLFVEAMFRLRSNQALLSSADAADGLYVDSEIRLEWKTPLFLLEFSMLPDLANPLSSITRSSIGLSWDF